MEVQILDSKEQVKGEIYKMRNKVDGKLYIGQAVTHRKNKGRYRPFGTMGRFKDHISEALCNTKTKQCWYLNAAIRKYGRDAFEVERLETCERENLDEREQYYIQHYNSMYPNGYNLTRGGKVIVASKTERDTETNASGKRGGCMSRSTETRERISQRLQTYCNNPETQHKRANHARQQHMATKLAKCKDIVIDASNIDDYIVRQAHRVVVRIQSHTFTFAGKHTTLDEKYEQAREFVMTLVNQHTCETSKLSGNP